MAALDLADTAGRTRVMLVDDHAIVREGYRSLLQKQDRLRREGFSVDHLCVRHLRLDHRLVRRTAADDHLLALEIG